MKKKSAWSDYANNPSIKKLILMSKIVFLLFFAGLLQVSAASYAQKTKMDLKMTNASMIDVFEKIEAQSEFRFFYDNSQVDLKQNVTVNLTDRKIEDILDELFKNTNITYEVMDRHILITSKGTATSAVTQDATRVRGKVTSEVDRQSLPGVSVIVKGTTVGVITDAEGNYSINVPQGGKVLVFSFIGMAPKEVTIGDQSVINVSLAENVVSVDEVVVIGYGTVKKSDLTGSVAVVSTKELTKNPAPSASAALQGKAPGVLVMQSAEPGGASHIRVRGIGSINGSSEPIYIVDGVRVGGISNIQPQEIESMQILKDASASAIYGANGSNGVVIVTTKRGKPGKTQVSLNSYVSLTEAPEQYDMMNADQYANFYRAIKGDLPEYDQAFREKYYGEGWQQGTNWQDQMFKTGLNQNYHISLSGGGENSNYQISMGYLKEDGTVIKTNAERYTIRANSDFKIGKHIKIGESISMNYHVKEVPMTNQIGIYDLISSPLMKVHNSFYKGGFESPQTIYWIDENGNLQLGSDPIGNHNYSNTLGNDKPNQLAAPSLGDDKRYGLGTLSTVYVQVDFTKWLTYKVTPAAEVNYYRNKAWLPRFTGNRAPGSASLNEEYGEGITLNLENQILINKKLGDHNIQATAVHQVLSTKNNSILGSEAGFDFEQLNTLANGGTTSSSLKGYTNSDPRMLSYLGRIIYDYKNKYLLTGSYRSDGISLFPTHLRRGHFLSGSVAWKLKEDLLQNVDQIDELKLRAGWGQTGNSDVGGGFKYVDKISENTQFSPVFGDDQHIARAQYVFYGLANPLFSWETAEMTNIGFDLNMFKNKLQMTAEYYIKDNNDLLVAINSSSVYGRIDGFPWYNAGNIRNSGLELSLQWREKKRGFEYGITSNLTTVKNEVKYLPVTDITSGNNRTIVGHSIGALYGYVSEGIIQLDESNYAKDNNGNWQKELDPQGNWTGNYVGYLHATHENNIPQPGDIRFKDLNGDGNINALDKTIIGKTMPSLIYSLGFDCNYKNFDFNIFLYGLTDFQIFNAQRANLSSMNSQDMDHNKLNDFAQNHWTLENASTTHVRVDYSNRNVNDRISTFWVENGSFLRVKDVQLGYTLGGHNSSKAGIASVRLYVNASNLFCFTKYKGRDPEGFVSNDPKNGGTDNGDYSLPRAFTGGLQVEF
ncbi:MAG: TonB-dependent receptor [Candidatus Saccharibacteria bacterium]